MQMNVMQHARWMTEHHIGAHMAITGQRSAPTYSLSLNNWMDFWSCHYLRVKFVLRLMIFIHALVHVLKTYKERSILPNKCKWKLFCKILKMFFFSIPLVNGEGLDTKFEVMAVTPQTPKCHHNRGVAEVVVTFGRLWCLSHDRKRGINFYSIMVPQN